MAKEATAKWRARKSGKVMYGYPCCFPDSPFSLTGAECLEITT